MLLRLPYSPLRLRSPRLNVPAHQATRSRLSRLPAKRRRPRDRAALSRGALRRLRDRRGGEALRALRRVHARTSSRRLRREDRGEGRLRRRPRPRRRRALELLARQDDRAQPRRWSRWGLVWRAGLCPRSRPWSRWGLARRAGLCPQSPGGGRSRWEGGRMTFVTLG